MSPIEHPPRRTRLWAFILVIALALTAGSALSASESPSEPPRAPVATSVAQEPVVLHTDTDKRLLPPTTTTLPPTTTTTSPPPPVAPTTEAPPPSSNGSGDPYDDASWYRLYECENGGYGWAANTGNGYYGGLQFSLSSWAAVGGAGRPDQASPGEQIARGKLLWEQGGWAHWPACTRSFGWR